MTKITFVSPDGTEITVEHDGPSQTLMELARRHDVPGITGDCGGAMACATCHLHIDPFWLRAVGPALDEEREIIDMTDAPREGSRLGCQIWVTSSLDGLQVRTAPH